jgi:hypothetical protein
MKYILAIILSVLTAASNAQHRHYQHHNHIRHHGNNWSWVAPALIGGAIVYGATRSAPPPVIYQPQPLPPAPYGYHYEQILDANCNCYRWVLVQG